jgi:hypothetical protein
LRVALACNLPADSAEALLSVALAGEPAAAMAAMPFAAARAKALELVLLGLHSPSPAVQAVAAGRIMACGADPALTNHMLASLGRLDESVRPTVSQYLAAESFGRYWTRYRRLGAEVRERAGRALLKLDGKVTDLLGARLVSRHPAQQLQAVEMVRQLGAAGGFEHTLCRLARQGDKRVRASAVRALTACESFHSRRILARCLDDADARVQANAVEALEAVGGDPAAVADKMYSPHNRVRGNAIRWLLTTAAPEAPAALATMLDDDRPAHRVSALWAAEQTDHRPAEAVIERISLGDSQTRIRARAATLLRRWRVGAAEVKS